MSAQKNKALVRRLIEAWNTRNWAALDELMAPDCIDHYALPDQKPGREGYREEQINATNAFPDIKFTIKDMIAERDKVAVHFTFTGTHRGEFMGITPTNKRVTAPEIRLGAIPPMRLGK